MPFKLVVLTLYSGLGLLDLIYLTSVYKNIAIWFRNSKLLKPLWSTLIWDISNLHSNLGYLLLVVDITWNDPSASINPNNQGVESTINR